MPLGAKNSDDQLIGFGKKVKLSHEIEESLRCPLCLSRIDIHTGRAQCTSPECGTEFRVFEGVPILLNPKSSLFSDSSALVHDHADSNIPIRLRKSSWKYWLPTLDRNIKGARNIQTLRKLLLERSNPNTKVRVLVIGGRVLGEGMEQLLAIKDLIEIVHTDVAFGPETQIVCDAHDLPFADNSFDCVIAQAVLEHVLDPWHCVSQIHRVLKHNGIAYAETPFIQQGHMGPYDFTRFTYLGHRNLFRKFTQIDAGALCGPGMALAWSYQYFLCSFSSSRRTRRILSLIARCTAFYLKYFDQWLINLPGTYDAASAYYFLGEKSEKILDSNELLSLYRGMN